MIAQSTWLSSLYTRWHLFRQHSRARWQVFLTGWHLFRRQPLGMLGVAIIIAYGIMAVVHPLLMSTVWTETAAGVRVYHPRTGFDPMMMHPSTPSARHWLGTDALGRDVFSMLIAATTPEFVLGLTAAVTTAVTGSSIGSSA